MARPQGRTDFTRRLRAYELYAAGEKKAAIASALETTRTTITNWSRKDRWDERLASVVARADEAVDHVTGNEVATAVATLRGRLRKRIEELEHLCSTVVHPATRIAAIRLWFDLSAKYNLQPDPGKSIDPTKLTLLQDLEPEPKEQ